MRLLIILIPIFFKALPATAETQLHIAVYQGFLPSQAGLISRIQDPLKNSELKLTFTEPLPPQRALTLAASGQLDGDVLRQPFAVEPFPSLIPIPVPLAKFDYWVWVPQSKRCPNDLEELKQLKPVGILGLKYFEFVYKLSEVGHEQVTSIPALMEMLKYNRAQYSLASEASAKAFSDATGVATRRCLDKPLVSTFGYFYLHEQHRKWISTLQKAWAPLDVSRQR